MPAGNKCMMQVNKIFVRADRVVVDVQVDPECALTTPALAEKVLTQRPRIAKHACVNSTGSTFADVIARTPLPHLFEHLILDVLTDIAPDAGTTFVGTSSWVDRRAARARVEFSYQDDLDVLAAIREAEIFLNNVTAS